MSTAILQVLGDPRGYRTSIYIIDGEEYEESLSSVAIYEWLKDQGKDAKIIFLAPDSLITKVGNDIDDAIDLLKDRRRFEGRILELLDGVEADILMIPSVGVYSGNFVARFEGSVDNTIAFIFTELVKRGYDEIYADISTGQNIYATSMLEALRKYATYRKLRTILQGRREVSLKIAYVSPVFVEGQEVDVEIHDFDVKAFFSLPTPNPKSICLDREKRREIQRRYGEFFNELSRDLKTLKMAFNAIKHNVPLAFYHPEILNLEIDVGEKEEILLKLVGELEDLRKIKVEGNSLIVERAILSSDNLTNTFFAIAMLSSIIDFWREKIDEPELKSILKTFRELYENLGLEVNSRFLERDLREIEELTKNFEGEALLLDLYASEKKSKYQKRNFFAHSGFLREITRVRKERDKITLRYDFEEMKRYSISIESWLQNP